MSNSNNSLDEIRKKIDDAKNIVIIGHTSPDGDAVGSCTGLAYILKEINKKVTILLENYAKRYDCVLGRNLVTSEFDENLKFDLAISLDCGDKERMGKAVSIFESCYNINIDHHISNVFFGNMNFVNPEASSTSELVYELAKGFVSLNKNSAQCLYMGILSDTGGFRHTNTSAYTMQIISELMQYQFDFSKIYNNIFNTHTLKETKFMGKALDKLKLYNQNKVAISYLTLEEIAEFNGSSDDLGSIVEYLKNIENIDVAVFLYSKGRNEIKVSMRSEKNINVSEICTLFGGGGHKKAAGCTLFTNMNEALNIIINTLNKYF